MDIPNLSNNQVNNSSPLKVPQKSKLIIIIIVVLAITSGFWISRFFPTQTAVSLSDIQDSSSGQPIQSNNLQIGTVYGNIDKNFKDNATGTIKSGGVNGEGTHTLEREGGVTQNAALTSSTVDLDLFVDKKVEVKGETNKSNKAAWLMDVGSIKILE